MALNKLKDGGYPLHWATSARADGGAVLRGIVAPSECPLFRKVCTPENPVGPCMVSSEGSCAAYFRYY